MNFYYPTANSLTKLTPFGNGLNKKNSDNALFINIMDNDSFNNVERKEHFLYEKIISFIHNHYNDLGIIFHNYCFSIREKSVFEYQPISESSFSWTLAYYIFCLYLIFKHKEIINNDGYYSDIILTGDINTDPDDYNTIKPVFDIREKALYCLKKITESEKSSGNWAFIFVDYNLNCRDIVSYLKNNGVSFEEVEKDIDTIRLKIKENLSFTVIKTKDTNMILNIIAGVNWRLKIDSFVYNKLNRVKNLYCELESRLRESSEKVLFKKCKMFVEEIVRLYFYQNKKEVEIADLGLVLENTEELPEEIREKLDFLINVSDITKWQEVKESITEVINWYFDYSGFDIDFMLEKIDKESISSNDIYESERELIFSIIEKISILDEDKYYPIEAIGKDLEKYSALILSFLKIFGCVSINTKDNIDRFKIVSKRAKYFLMSLREYIFNDIPIFEEWNSTQGKLPIVRISNIFKSSQFLYYLEEKRVKTTVSSEPLIINDVVRIIIKTQINNSDHYLFQLDENSNQYQSIGGFRNKKDMDIESCGIRKLKEELPYSDFSKKESFVLSEPVKTIKEKRVSFKTCVYSSYTIYFLHLKKIEKGKLVLNKDKDIFVSIEDIKKGLTKDAAAIFPHSQEMIEMLNALPYTEGLPIKEKNNSQSSTSDKRYRSKLVLIHKFYGPLVIKSEGCFGHWVDEYNEYLSKMSNSEINGDHLQFKYDFNTDRWYVINSVKSYTGYNNKTLCPGEKVSIANGATLTLGNEDFTVEIRRIRN